MCDKDRETRENLSCSCIHDILKKICLIQKQDLSCDDFSGCDKPFLGPTPTTICYNTRPIQLFNCCTGELWTFPFSGGTSTIFRVETLDDCCCTCRILNQTGTNTYTATNEFFTINLDCVGAVKCLPDVFVDLC